MDDCALDDGEDFEDAVEQDQPNGESGDSTFLINAATSRASTSDLEPGDIRRVMSTSSVRGAGKEQKKPSGKLTAKTHVTYRVSNHKRLPRVSLVDRGANGGVAGMDVRQVSKTSRTIDIEGIDNHS